MLEVELTSQGNVQTGRAYCSAAIGAILCFQY